VNARLIADGEQGSLTGHGGGVSQHTGPDQQLLAPPARFELAHTV